MSTPLRYALCATDNDGKIYLSGSPDGYAWPQPQTPLFVGMTSTRSPVLTAANDRLHMFLTGPDGQILHSVYDESNGAWPLPQAGDLPFAGSKVYHNGGYVPPSILPSGDGFWLFFVDNAKTLHACLFDGQNWGSVTPVDFPPGQTEDTPSFVRVAQDQLLMCAADTSGRVALYGPTNPHGDPTSWQRVSDENVINQFSTYYNRTPALLVQKNTLTILAPGDGGVIRTATWPVGQYYSAVDGQPLFAGDNWKCPFAPVPYQKGGKVWLCLSDNRGRLYFAPSDGAGGWVHPDDPYSWWNGWETGGSATPSLCRYDFDGPDHPGYAWMSGIDDDTQLSHISIPGTHDSLTYRVSNANPASQCQTLPFLEQLQCGVRYFDLRPGVTKDPNGTPDFNFFHGPTDLDVTFKQIYAVILDFLTAFPSETVILALQDHNDDHDPQGFMDTLDHFVHQQPDAWYLTNDVPGLTAVRGKIVLFRRFKIPDGHVRGVDLSIGWNNSANYDRVDPNDGEGMVFYIQDDYSWPAPKWESKVDTIDAMIGYATAQSLGPAFYMNFTNAATGGTPIWFKDRINPAVINKLNTLSLPSCVGVLGMDYVTEDIVRLIFLTNFEAQT